MNRTALQDEVSRLWALMCEEDGIDPASKFTIFSPTNKYAAEYNSAMAAFLSLRCKQEANAKARRDRHAAMKDLGLKRVVGGLGGVYYE